MARTIAFLVAAACSVGLAAVTQFATRPPEVAGFDNVGEPFYTDEEMDPNDAVGLRVIAYNEDTASAKTFSVEFKDGSWRIPSHHFYPADGEDRLAKTASSVIAVQRGALASPRKSDHEEFGVIDPLDDSSTSLKGRGQRITLLKEGDTPMVDFIIGNKYEGQGGGSSYYVRRKDEDATYITDVEIDLSTKFADWIEPDLLKMDRDSLVSLNLKRPLMDATGNRIVGEDVNELTREKSSDPWKLDKLDEKTEELNEDDVRSMVSALDDLKIVGVRPKPQFQDKTLLTPDLTFDPPKAIAENPQLAQSVFNQVQTDLARKGFFLFEDKEGNRRLVSREGDINAATNEGVVYHLHFGQLFTGSEEEIEVGGAADEEAADKENKDEAADAEGDDSDENVTKSRYLFVRVEYDPSFLGEKPVEPTQPTKPGEEGKEKAEDKASDKKADDKKVEEKKADEKKESDEKSSEKKEETEDSGSECDEDSQQDESAADEADEKKDETEKKADVEKKADNKDDAAKDDTKPADKADERKDDAKPAEEKVDPEEAYKKALETYEQELRAYNTAKEDYEKKEVDGKKQVEELNARFADWYYVISSESFETLRLTREDLVKKKEKPADEEKPKEDSAEKKPEEGEKKDESKEKPASGDAKSAEKKSETKDDSKPADSAKKADKKATPKADTKPESKKADDSKPKAKSADSKKKADSGGDKKKE